ncbi:MAG: tungsten cofactor oxidoreductase radical SAM maturase [Methanomassiliicoccales archaeon]
MLKFFEQLLRLDSTTESVEHSHDEPTSTQALDRESATADGNDPIWKSFNLLKKENQNRWILEATADRYILHRATHDVRKIFLEVTTRCNLRCASCIRHAWDEELTDMSYDTFCSVLKSIQNLPEVKEVHFGGFGEPLMHPRILDMVREVKSLGLRVSISTNGTLFNEEIANSLVNIGVDRIFVSMDSTQAQIFGDLRIGADFYEVVENVKRLNLAREKKGSRFPTIGLEFVATKENFDDIKNVPQLAKELGASIVIITHLLPYTKESAHKILYNGDYGKFPRSEGWSVVAGDYVMWGTMSLPRNSWGAHRQCRFIEEKGTVIAHDGSVSPCYALMHSYNYFIFGEEKHVKRYVFGNVNNTTLADIWSSEQYVLFRSRVRDFKFPSCVDCGANCDLRKENQDCWANDPSCADCLWAQDIIRCP